MLALRWAVVWRLTGNAGHYEAVRWRKRHWLKAQTSVPVEALQILGQIPFAMEVAKALSMEVPNMTLERVFLTKPPTGERWNLMKHDQNRRKLVRAARQMIVDTARSEIHMAARLVQAWAALPKGIFDYFSLDVHAIQQRIWTEMRGYFLSEVVWMSVGTAVYQAGLLVLDMLEVVVSESAQLLNELPAESEVVEEQNDVPPSEK
jgi:hypothetical protein